MNRVIFGDCRDTMRDLIAQGVKAQMCVTSPPYYSLRDYGHPGQIGLEKTPAEYVAALVEVFGLVRDMLADDGVLFLNLGDSYARNGGEQGGRNRALMHLEGSQARMLRIPDGSGLKPKDLIGIPWRVAFALQAAGWYLRQDIIWHKPNPMPESVTDRCTKAHEYLFLLTTSERYYWDAEAMQEPAKPESAARYDYAFGGAKAEAQTASEAAGPGTRTHPIGVREDTGMRNRRSVWTVATQPYSGAHFAVFPAALIEPCILAGSRPGDLVLDPFMGSGTTAQVAQALGRQWIGCELNTEYAPLQLARTAQAALAI
jgi:DNA modification methylase